MRQFILRARGGPTSEANVRPNVGGPAHVEVISQTIIAAIFVSKQVRDDVVVHICLDGPSDPPKTLTLDSSSLFLLTGFHEDAITAEIERGLRLSSGMAREETRQIDDGFTVCRVGFEKTVRAVSERMPVYILDKRGEDIRDLDLGSDVAFVLTDHIPMAPKSLKLLQRLGAQKISLGPRVLFAAHCVVVVHNELDRRAR